MNPVQNVALSADQKDSFINFSFSYVMNSIIWEQQAVQMF